MATLASPLSLAVGSTNTFQLAGDTIYTLVSEYCGSYSIDMLNLGPCTVYLRYGADPAVNDPASLTLPFGSAYNGFRIPDGTVGLRATTGPPCVWQALQPVPPDPNLEPCESQLVPFIDSGATISVRLNLA